MHRTLLRLLPRLAATLLAGGLVISAVPSTAIAQDTAAAAKPPDKKTRNAARQAFSDGEKAFTAGDFAAAYDNFKKAHELIPTPHTEYWMAKSLDQQDKTTEAIEAYEAYLQNSDAATAGDDKVQDATKRLAELKASLTGTISLVTDPMGAQVIVDGEPQAGETPMILELAPGMHKVSVNLQGYETQMLELEVGPGEKAEQKLELVLSEPEPAVATAPPVAPPPPPPPAPKERSMVPAYVTLGIAGAGAIVGTIFGIQALSAKSDFDDNPTNETADDVERNALIADMAFGVAITLGVTGVVLLTSDDPGSEAASRSRPSSTERATLRVAPYVSPTGGGAAAHVTF